MKKKGIAAVLLFALAAGCKPPTYTRYRSVFKDYVSSLPTGWNVYTDAQGQDFAETRFIGPFDGDALFGLPSFSVKWFRNYHVHVLRDGQAELYANGDDYIKQTLSEVYGYSYRNSSQGTAVLLSAAHNESGEFTSILARPEDIPSLPPVAGKSARDSSDLPLKMFIIRSPVRVSSRVRWGVDIGPDGKPYNNRMHAYAVLSLPDGFYVISYPATVRSFARHFPLFEELVWNFHPLTDGPGGAKITLRRFN